MENIHNLNINGVDYNKELDLLSEYLRMGIETCPPIRIDVSQMPIGYNPEDMIKLYKQSGIMFYSAQGATPSIEILTFQEWKKSHQSNMLIK